MQKIRSMLDGVMRWMERIGVVFLVLMVVLVFANSVSRYVFRFGLNQVEELSRFAFVWLSFLGSAVAYYRKEHITIPIMVDRLQGTARAVVNIIAQLVITATFVYFLYSSFLYTMNTIGVRSPGTGLFFGFVAVSSFVMAACALLVDFVNFLEYISLRAGRPESK